MAVSTVGNVGLVCETSARRFDPGRSPQMFYKGENVEVEINIKKTGDNLWTLTASYDGLF